MSKKKKSRQQKSKARHRSVSHASPTIQVSEQAWAIAMKIKALETTRNVDIVRPKVGGRYQGKEKGLLCSDETFLVVVACSERDECGDFQVECYDDMENHLVLNAIDWEFQRIIIGNEGEYTMLSLL
ncbi:hypothetical protein [Vibrio parahaemolyticus]|uniref:Uncharacterized protein n=1 Tax=Vibrio parahaemolyticus TaxID=670 RepID=A0AAX1G181_VIBPH|nr:hypothetical protein [Vibrio parahaemolyticus]EGQ8535422.1 hypothetical protein [Vibrio parahaemolyticus]EJB8505181.1 hypothetical protein [Vibrio parahaemolyticus]EJL3960077.1 hypothetical protein [Vibrio parahaemolyticus]MCR9868045.1 hypothetical protein [Vibrio parahaemolyticus]OUD67561.1 hypothetical protein BTN34_22305 [Vibrio parahaemolyticus]